LRSITVWWRVRPAFAGPRDKAPVENAVKVTYREIFTALDGLHCPDASSLNDAGRATRDRHNNRNLDRRNYSRREYFDDIERESPAPLNPIRFRIRRHVIATVGKDGYVRLSEDVHYYSVPHTYIGKRVRISYSALDVQRLFGSCERSDFWFRPDDFCAIRTRRRGSYGERGGDKKRRPEVKRARFANFKQPLRYTIRATIL